MNSKSVKFLALVPLVLSAFGCSDDSGGAGPTVAPVPPSGSARCGDAYPNQSGSPYILPWQTGLSFNVGQGNCTDGSHATDSADRFAYDIDMPIGTSILAARAGTVLSLEERFVDGNRTPGAENFVNVRHDDGSVGVYFHLTHQGVVVEVGAQVTQGQLIARSGDTGDSTEPHLHFQVDACGGCDSTPVSFRNTRSHVAGLVEGESYRAD